MTTRSKELPRHASSAHTLRTRNTRKKRGRQDDVWPTDEDEQDLLMIQWREEALERLRWREPNVVRLEQIVDAALDRLLARRHADPPEHPAAWLWSVARQLVRSRAIYTRPTIELTWEPQARVPDEVVEDRRCWVDAHLDVVLGCLTAREAAIFTACREHGSLPAVAAALGEHVSNVSHAIGRVGNKVWEVFCPKQEEFCPIVA